MNKKIKFLITIALLIFTFEPINPSQVIKPISGGVELSDDGSEAIPAPEPIPVPEAPAPAPEPVQEAIPEVIPQPSPEPVQESVLPVEPKTVEVQTVEEVIAPLESGTGEIVQEELVSQEVQIVEVQPVLSGDVSQEVISESGTGEVVEEVLVPQETLETYMAAGERPLSCLDLLSKIKDKNEQPKIIDWFTGDSKWASFKESIKIAFEYISTNIFALFLKISTLDTPISEAPAIPVLDKEYTQDELFSRLSAISSASECMDFYNTIFVNPDYKTYQDYLKAYNPNLTEQTFQEVEEKIEITPETEITEEVIEEIVQPEVPEDIIQVVTLPKVTSARISPTDAKSGDNLSVSNVVFENNPSEQYTMSYQWQEKYDANGYYDKKYLNATDLRSYSFGEFSKKKKGYNQNVSSVDIGFNFNFYGVNYSKVNVSSNSFLSFAPFHDATDISKNLDLPVISPFAVKSIKITDSEFQTQTFGDAPNRIFGVMWNSTLKSGDKMNVRMQLYEKDNSILISYKNGALSEKIIPEVLGMFISPDATYDAKYPSFDFDFKEIFKENHDIRIFPKSNFLSIEGQVSDTLTSDMLKLGASYRLIINESYTSEPVIILKNGGGKSNVSINQLNDFNKTNKKEKPIKDKNTDKVVLSGSGEVISNVQTDTGFVADTAITTTTPVDVIPTVSEATILNTAITSGTWSSFNPLNFLSYPSKLRINVETYDQLIYNEQILSFAGSPTYIVIKLSDFKDKYSNRYINNDVFYITMNDLKSTGTESNGYRYYIFPMISITNQQANIRTFVNFLANTPSGVYALEATYTLVN